VSARVEFARGRKRKRGARGESKARSWRKRDRGERTKRERGKGGRGGREQVARGESKTRWRRKCSKMRARLCTIPSVLLKAGKREKGGGGGGGSEQEDADGDAAQEVEPLLGRVLPRCDINFIIYTVCIVHTNYVQHI
jgi:hypothetical protein